MRSQTRTWLILLAILVPLIGLIVGAWWWSGRDGVPLLGGYQEVHWKTLGEWNGVNPKPPKVIGDLANKKVRIPGFMVPLEDYVREVREFLLVPIPQACIHLPPPPPNQMILVRSPEKPAMVLIGPIWVYGTLRIGSQSHFYGESLYHMDLDEVTPYRR